MVLARYQSSKLQIARFGELLVWRTIHLSGTSVWRFSDMSAKSETVGKLRIPDRLGFSRHMKTRLNGCEN